MKLEKGLLVPEGPMYAAAKDTGVRRLDMSDIEVRHTPREIMLASAVMYGLSGTLYLEPLVRGLLDSKGVYVPATEYEVEKLVNTESERFCKEKGLPLPRSESYVTGGLRHNEDRRRVWGNEEARKMAAEELLLTNPELFRRVADYQLERSKKWVIDMVLEQGYLHVIDPEKRWEEVFGKTQQEYLGQTWEEKQAKLANKEERDAFIEKLDQDLIPVKDEDKDDESVHARNRERYERVFAYYRHAKNMVEMGKQK